jgi:hypothetical protein
LDKVDDDHFPFLPDGMARKHPAVFAWEDREEDVVIENADNGVILQRSHHCEIRRVTMEGDLKAHHGVSMRLSHDNLVEHWHQKMPVHHGVGVQDDSSGNVFSRCILEEGTLDCHLGMPFDNVRTEIDLRRASGMAGGALGPYAGRKYEALGAMADAAQDPALAESAYRQALRLIIPHPSVFETNPNPPEGYTLSA